VTRSDDPNLAISFDVGGTFTDFVIVDLTTGEIAHSHKVLTNARYPARGVLRGWNEMFRNGLRSSSVVLAVHSTTLVTNSIIERKGARTTLLTTRGFRDILELAREQMYDIYDLFAPPPEPLIARPYRLEIDERTMADGEVLTPPSEASIKAAIELMQQEHIEAVAISFLHSYRNPENERHVGQQIAHALPDVTISLSSDVAPIAGEYERTSTAAADAYTKPLLSRYVNELEKALAGGGLEVDLQLVLSSGEIASAASAVRYPVRLLESGPASGAMAAAFFGRLAGHEDVLSLDMGGTTAKACVIEHGKPELAHLLEAARVRRFMKGSGLPIVAPVVDLIEIGAGGGSIARRDELGLLKVGPDSAGADPGPACYGLGGERPTVSDANLLLGYLSADYFLGGTIPLCPDNARKAIARLGEELELSVEDTAWGIHRVVNENMAAAARMHIIERNRDPRSLATIAFGGAGPAHAVAVARLLGSRTVIFPPGAGVASALGALVSPVAFTAGRTLMTRLDQADWNEINNMFAGLEQQALAELAGAGVAANDVSYRRWAEMRLEGQYHEISVDLPNGRLDENALPAIESAFAAAYARQYGRVLEGLAIETLHWRLTATGPESAVTLKRHPASSQTASTALKDTRGVYFPAGGYRDVPVYDRDRLQSGMRFDGPAIVEERESTAVIWPEDTVLVDEYLALVVQIGGVSE
jgi:N-methylhydantoinase A/oxoprolinase/acetone carboxylase beta subunit